MVAMDTTWPATSDTTSEAATVAANHPGRSFLAAAVGAAVGVVLMATLAFTGHFGLLPL
jgi:hypothetical protein